MKKVRKTTRTIGYDLNQIPYDYTVEVTNRFKGLVLIEFCQENALVIANTLFQQHKRRLYTWTSPDG